MVDIKVYKDNATLGVGKLDYIIASGIKQHDIVDQFNLEGFLKLNDITPMQTSYTQTAQDRVEDEGDKGGQDNSDSSNDKTEIEPSVEQGRESE